ncbi:MAG: cupin domain-containing protein [Planctomycetales bacterium]|nr:cupin domain-containing protein [Planctomycetales bacterium]
MDSPFLIRQLGETLAAPESGKLSQVLVDDEHAKVMLMAFAAGAGLPEHVSPLPAILQIVHGEAELTVGDQAVAGRPGTWIRMAPNTPHSILARTPVHLLLALLK